MLRTGLPLAGCTERAVLLLPPSVETEPTSGAGCAVELASPEGVSEPYEALRIALLIAFIVGCQSVRQWSAGVSIKVVWIRTVTCLECLFGEAKRVCRVLSNLLSLGTISHAAWMEVEERADELAAMLRVVSTIAAAYPLKRNAQMDRRDDHSSSKHRHEVRL